jgi:COP9 signalosome complex subunit 2
MSDYDDEYEFEYEDADEDMDEDMDIENEYYGAKSIMDSDPDAALAAFQKVVAMEPEKGKWGFKALKRTVKILARLGRLQEAVQRFGEMLTYTKTAVTRNDSEKALNSIMDYLAACSAQPILHEIYGMILQSLEGSKNERLWFATLQRSGRLAFDTGDYARVNRILKDLYSFCRNEDGMMDAKKGTQLLEVYALDIMLCTAQKNNKKLKEIYERSLSVKAAIPHPRIMGIIRECGGKMYMMEKRWEDAFSAFFEAFKNYDEAGHPRRTQCLKYLVLNSMLTASGIDPFDSQEAKPYKSDPDIMAMMDLLNAYQADDVHEFERILRVKRKAILDDEFMRDCIEDLLLNIRTQVLLKMVKPFSRVRLGYIAQELNISEEDVEQLTAFLVLDGRIKGSIDQVDRVLELKVDVSADRESAISKWLDHIETVQSNMARKVMNV